MKGFLLSFIDIHKNYPMSILVADSANSFRGFINLIFAKQESFILFRAILLDIRICFGNKYSL